MTWNSKTNTRKAEERRRELESIEEGTSRERSFLLAIGAEEEQDARIFDLNRYSRDTIPEHGIDKKNQGEAG